MTKRMSKTLAAEIADRTLEVVNPHNRSIALHATLRRHGFAPSTATISPPLEDRSLLVAWLLARYWPQA